MIDAGVAYVMKDYFAKLALFYTNAKYEIGDADAVKSNALQLAFQIQQ